MPRWPFEDAGSANPESLGLETVWIATRRSSCQKVLCPTVPSEVRARSGQYPLFGRSGESATRAIDHPENTGHDFCCACVSKIDPVGCWLSHDKMSFRSNSLSKKWDLLVAIRFVRSG